MDQKKFWVLKIFRVQNNQESKRILVLEKNLGSKTFRSNKILDLNQFWVRINFVFKNISHKKFCVQKFYEAEGGGDHQGGVKTFAHNSLTYLKSTYQILVSWYAQNPSKSFWWVVVSRVSLGLSSSSDQAEQKGGVHII